jgi:hypothetical protein
MFPERCPKKKMTRPDGRSVANDAKLGGRGNWSLAVIEVDKEDHADKEAGSFIIVRYRRSAR